MGFSNRLCNPTPFPVDWNYNAGVYIKIEPDGFFDMTDPIMCEQMRPDVPGGDAIRDEMHHYGIFLRDPSVPYEVQALEALKEMARLVGQRYDAAAGDLKRKAVADGIFNEEAFQEHLDSTGHGALKQRLDKIEARIKMYTKRIDPSLMRRATREQYDPSKTLLFMDPPKVFESAMAMEIFLEENPDLKARQDRWLQEVEARQAVTEQASAQ